MSADELECARIAMSFLRASNELLSARVAKLETTLESIANTYDESWRTGCQERRIGDEARAALKDDPAIYGNQ